KAVRAFQSQSGLYVDGEFGPMSYETLDQKLRASGGYFHCGVANAAPDAGFTTLSFDALRAGTASESTIHIYASPNPGPTLVFVGCIHGNEKSGHHGLTHAIDAGITLSRGRLVLIPAFNAMACS